MTIEIEDIKEAKEEENLDDLLEERKKYWMEKGSRFYS